MPTGANQGDFNDILTRIKDAISSFNDSMPAAQREMYREISAELKRLDTDGDRIKVTVANMKVVNSIKNKLTRLLLTDKYLKNVKEFANAFNDLTKLQNEYWTAAEAKFTPKTLLKEIKTQAIKETVSQLTEQGIGANISSEIGEMLNSNVKSGGSYKALQEQLLESLTDTQKSDGVVTKYAKQITTDSINQYNAQYTQAVQSDLGFEWYAYQGSDIETTRPFCDAMTDIRYFHVTEVPRLLAAEGLYYINKKTGKREQVPIYAKTGLPNGMIEGTNESNFFIRRGGYNCGHQIRPVNEQIVPLDRREEVYSTQEYKDWAEINKPAR